MGTPPTIWFEGASTFSAGMLVGAVMLCSGLALGIWLGWRMARQGGLGLSQPQMQQIISRLTSVTHGVTADMTQYREVMDLAQQRMREIKDNPQAGDESTLQLLAQMTQANELLQGRIQQAENTLQGQSQQIATYRNEARTDSLTQVSNRRAFDAELQRRLAEWRRHGTRFLLVVLDVDRFKLLNDTYGHLAGDAVLARLAAVLRETLRDTDLVARYGGEEFALLLPAGELGQVTDSLERIRVAVAAAEIRFENKTLQITISVGAAEPTEREAAESLIRRADEALYAAKQAGRNRCYYHDGAACVALTSENDIASRQPQLAKNPAVSADFHQVCADLRKRLEEVTRR